MENNTSSIPRQTSEHSLPLHHFLDPTKRKPNELILILLVAIITYRIYIYRKSNLNLPYIGDRPSLLLGSWKSGLAYMRNSEELIRAGYKKYAPTGQPFVIATLPRPMVFLTDPGQIEEVRMAKECDLSFNEAVNHQRQMRLVMHPSLMDGPNAYHIDVIRQNLTQRLAAMLSELHMEVDLAWRETSGVVSGQDWTRVKVWDVMMAVISRTSNRIFVGAPLCRNQAYLDIMLTYAMKVGLTIITAENVPFLLRRPLIWFLLKRHRLPQQGEQILGPIFDERRRRKEELGAERWEKEKPKDAVQWLLDASASRGAEMQSNEQLTLRLMSMNFAAIHTTTISVTHVLYDLATYPEYLAPLREEVISVLGAYGGYTKQSLTAMKKLDSVLKESLRHTGVSSITMSRMLMRDFTFSAGRTPISLPKGTFITVPSRPVHLNEAIYGADAAEWKGFRFAEQREEKDAGVGLQFVSTSMKFLAFGHGRHACPGRFFAANELKMLLSYLLLRYEFRLPEEFGGKRPRNKFGFGSIMPDPSVQLEFREIPGWRELVGRWELPVEESS